MIEHKLIREATSIGHYSEFEDIPLVDVLYKLEALIEEYGGRATLDVDTYDGYISVVSLRDETQEEYDRRVRKHLSAKKAAARRKLNQAGRKEAQERDQYEKLKAKFEVLDALDTFGNRK